MRKALLSLVIAAAVAGCQQGEDPKKQAEQADAVQSGEQATQLPLTPEDTQQDETARLTEWFDAKYEEELKFSPIQLSYLGRKELYSEIDDMTKAAAESQLAWKKTTVDEMKQQFDYDKLSTEGKESYDLWIQQYELEKANLPFWDYSYFASELGGPEAQFPTFLINQHKVDTEQDMRDYITRIGGISTALSQLLERAKVSANKEIRPPQFTYDLAIERAQKVTTGKPFSDGDDAPLMADAKKKIAALQDAGTIDEATAKDLLTQVETALTSQMKPSYDAYIGWLQEDKVNADEVPKGVSHLPDGDSYYNNRLANHTTQPMTAEEVHQIGLDEVARIRKEMEAIKDKVGFDGNLQEFFTFIRTDDQFYYPNTDEGRKEYLDKVDGFLADIDAKLPEYFGILPKAKLIVKRVEPFREVPGGAQHYVPGTPDGSRPGTYYVHMSDMSALSTADMETVTYHEGNPGHHMQISIAQELENIPKFRTNAFSTAYIEGWALYSEKLSKEMGQFQDPYNDFGRLTAEMWRAIRLVVDTGMHAKGWSQDQAVEYFLENSAIPETAVRSEVRRYLTYPGQATAYKIGMLKIEELRSKAEETLGDKFDIRGFHDTILGGGALPLPLLEQRVENWIADQKQSKTDG
ncbi:hypothetical protein Mag101_16925 [Microbulbifer agarilyticus]|uniref:DUF885 domain-containing protein n=1 Tax=Microbulbifer agarilyticus TaxID=260552 RepID=A0A1Q2M8P8_9GAMM|nr:DUF885 domain-containing protein [Microbulbifer agarilyticus]AQQ69125.1 hypothetical protein Mag101_16925 [Microbulbifer agarilyticus]